MAKRYEATVDYAESLMHSDYKRMMREYSHMREVANKRIKRLGQSEYAWTKTYQYHQYGFKRIRDINKADFAKAYSELASFFYAKGSTISGQREIQAKTTKTLQAEGLNVNKGNYANLIKIFERMRKMKLLYGSDKAVSLAEAMTHVDKATQEKWLNNLEHMLPIADELVTMPDDEGDEFDDLDFWDDDE